MLRCSSALLFVVRALRCWLLVSMFFGKTTSVSDRITVPDAEMIYLRKLTKEKPMTVQYSPAFLQAMPKADLHLHLDGSLRPEGLIDMAKRSNIELPSYSVDGLYDLVFKESYQNLGEYLN